DAVDRGAVDHQHPRARGKQIGAAGEGALGQDALAGDGPGDRGGRHVLGNLALLEPHHDDLFDAGILQRFDLARADGRAFLQDKRSLAQGMDGHPANRFSRTGRTELHAASSFSLAGSRNCAVISAMTATAISDGDTAPIGRPIGAWMRAMSVSLAPSARNRSARLPWVFREPRAPI